MDHQQATERFSAYLDGELPDGERKALSEHLQGCDSCRQDLERLRSTLRSLSGLHSLPPPPEFAHKVERRIHRRSRGRFFGVEPLLSRVPFEWISFIIIIFLLAMYFILVVDRPQVSPNDAPEPAPAPTTQDRRGR